MNDVYDIIDEQQLHKNIKRSSVQGIFDKVDINKIGAIATEDFMKALENDGEANWINEYFNSLQGEITSKSVIIIKKLKEMRDNANLNLDAKTLDDLDW